MPPGRRGEDLDYHGVTRDATTFGIACQGQCWTRYAPEIGTRTDSFSASNVVLRAKPGKVPRPSRISGQDNWI
ncbi:hypothetical protein K402DRAFT_142127 [Aulographum hederae CBS 113979]|uniref:Uncharacterized protein n=1 Tax=Aulographum hederae CBS 113979 TaxID=1176131 RepID=A0A6G1GUA6_9PEZI|nr:hypothetical protein K402DRAFT_142127 [Aulographum hederae CBS 113979]